MNTKFAASLFIALLLLVGACKRNDQQVQFELSVPVSVMVLKPTVIEEYINATGSVFPVKEVTLTSRVEGDYYLQNNPRTGKPYSLGDQVNKGEVLIKLVDKEYENSIHINTVKLNWEVSKMEYDKQKSLYDKGGVTMRELKDGEISYNNAETEYETAQINLDKMKVYSPFSGTITDLPYFTNGTRLASGTEAVTLMNYREMMMYVNLPEKNYSQVKEGQDVYITNYSMPEDTLIGKIDQISPAIDPDARTFKCVVTIDNPNRLLLPGMFVKADLVTNRVENALVIPKEIVKTRGYRTSVFTIRDGAADERRIRTGISNGGDIMVTDGLNSGDRIVIKGYETLRNRSKVKVMNEEVQVSEMEEGQEGAGNTPQPQGNGQRPGNNNAERPREGGQRPGGN